MADVLAHQVLTGDADEVALLDVAQLVEHLFMRRATMVLPVPGFPVNDM